MTETLSDASKEEILKEARDRFAYVQDIDKENKDQARSDTRFVFVPGKQWDDDIRTRRKNWKDPCFEFNQLKQFVHQVVNDQRQNRPGIRIHPANGQASEEVAKIEQGMIRGIEYDSHAETVYDHAYQDAVVGGRGYWRICTEYVDSTSFDQKIVLKSIADPDMVWLDPDFQQPDGSDRNYGFVMEGVTKDEFERQWPDADPVSFSDIPVSWRDGEKLVFIADYYRRVCKKRTLVRNSDGAMGFEDEMPKLPDGVETVSKREVETYTVEWYKIAGGTQILAKYDIPGEIIPVIEAAGNVVVVDGKRMYQGLIRQARDAQAMFNFGMTQQAIHLALTPRAPWVAAEGQIEGYENIWKNANVENYSVLPYKPVTVDGVVVPPPQRTQPSTPDAGWMTWCQTMTGLLRSTIGMYENSLGMKAQETSGRAILAREKQGDNATFHYVDNLSRAIALTGRIIVDWIPKYYDTQRIVHIIGPDGVRQEVTINETSINPSNPLEAIRLNDVTVGKYSVVVEAGPSYATKRQETAETLTQLAQAYPPIMEVAGDLVVKAQEIPDADVIAERLRLTLPPAVQQQLQAKEKKQQPPDPQMIAAMQEKDMHLQQAMQTMQEMEKQLQSAQSGEQSKIAQIQANEKLAQMELESKERIALATAQINARAKLMARQMELEAEAQAKAMEGGMHPLEQEQMLADITDTYAAANLKDAQAEALENQEPKSGEPDSDEG